MDIAITILPHGEGLPVPQMKTSGSAGFDLSAAITRHITIGTFERILIPCGFSLALPQGYEAQIRPRSGLALSHGVTVLNAPGTIDCDYRGEIGALLINQGPEVFTIRRGDRVAQMVIARYEKPNLVLAQNLNPTARGASGFGSTGIN